MKKLFTALLCAILSLSVIFSVGCSSSVFNANYQKVEASEVSNFATTLSAEAESVEYNTGVKTLVKVKKEIGGVVSTIDINVTAIETNGKLEMSGSSTYNLNGKQYKEQIYYVDGTLYENENGEKTYEFKNKADIVEDLLEVLEDVEMPKFKTIDLVMEFSEYTNAEFYIEKGENTKIKFVLPESTVIKYGYEAKLSQSIFLVFNAQNKLTAYKTQAKSVYSRNNIEYKSEMEVSVEPWTGKITPPNDLNTYLPD